MAILFRTLHIARPEKTSKRLFKTLFALLLLCSVMALLLAGCSTATSATSTKSNEVHMTMTDFVQHSVTIKKGERLTLINDTFMPHAISNGTWEQGIAKPAREPGVPEVKDVLINGNGQTSIGPFPTSGTFHLYCTMHAGMNLTVIVQ